MRRLNLALVIVFSLSFVIGYPAFPDDRVTALPRASTPSRGTMAFTPVGDQSKIPTEYRLEPHEFPWEMTVKTEQEKEGFRVYHVTFPSAVTTKYAENNTVHCEWYR